jgi:hypothetical protein
MTMIDSSRDRTARAAGIREVLRVRIELWIAVVFMAAAFGAGMAVNAVSQPEPTPATASVDGGGVLPFAPPLTDQQLQGGLPPGHPDLNGDGGTSGKAGTGDQGSKTRSTAEGSASGGADSP